jgi:predicted naringenin-chalcone synthase
MPTYIHHIETLVPETSYPQERIVATLKRCVARGDRRTERIIHHLYAHSGIEKRHSAMTDFVEGNPGGAFYNPETDTILTPSTEVRNQLYTQSARELLPALVEKAIARCPHVSPSDLTHLITVSCTGFFQPGPDFAILQSLGLHAGVERYHLGFMGCYAAFPALRMAQAFCTANPNATVLVVCLELCSLHLQWTSQLDDLLAGSVFADGAGAVVLSGREPESGGYRLDAFASAIAPANDSDMAWTIGDTGFRMRLSSYVPEILQANVEGAISPVLEKAGLSREAIDRWAVHPGGRAIVDKVEKGLSLPETALEASRNVLREYGNMSSTTILFVLHEIGRQQNLTRGERVLAMSFGPGLTVETAILTAV